MVSDAYTENAINEWIVAAVAHGEPVEDEEHDVDIFPLIHCRSHNTSHEVSLPWQPTDGEDNHHHQHHLQNLTIRKNTLFSSELCKI